MAMNIKQQKQIEAFLIEEFGNDRAAGLFASQEKTLHALIESESNKSEKQMEKLIQRIFPCIALYKALMESGISQEEAYAHVCKYMLANVAAQQHASMLRMELVPGFYAIYSKMFIKVMRMSDLWKSTQSRGKDFFDVTISKCLWHTACTEKGCAEMCRLFCDVDNVSYGGLKKIGFSRTKTLGYGGDCCDFHFYKK